MMKSYFRPEIDALAGYTPGEQPKLQRLVKLNTNENPYPPSPKAMEAIRNLSADALRRYPDPAADALCKAVAARYGVDRNQVIAGNGSDDILTMVFRAFTAPDKPVAVLEPSYSLYPVLAAMQGAPVIRIPLVGDNFALPEDILEQAKDANFLAIVRPNAPTGTQFPKEAMRKICAGFDGIVMIDEAYADFASDNCMDLVREFPNLVVSRTFSKSYSFAGMRLGYAVSSPEVIYGLGKLKDSYNVDAVAQAAGLASFEDTEYFGWTRDAICRDREQLRNDLQELGFKIVPSEANFLFAAPPDGDGEGCFRYLRENAVIVRYFPGPVTGAYVRITIGTPEQNAELLELTAKRYRKA